MNLNLHGDGLRLISVRHDGADLRALSPTLTARDVRRCIPMASMC